MSKARRQAADPDARPSLRALAAHRKPSRERVSLLESLVRPALVRAYGGNVTALARALGTGNAQALSRAIRLGQMDTEQCLRLAKATRVPAVAILHAVGKHTIAELILALFGPEKEVVLTEADRVWLSLEEARRRSFIDALSLPTLKTSRSRVRLDLPTVARSRR